MTKNLLSFICIILLSFTVNAQTGVKVPELAAFDAAMLNLMSKYNVPGGQLAVTYQGRLVYNRGFGLANTETKDSVYPNSLFRIASVSKTVTSIACMKLFEQGLLKLDAKVFGPNGILNDAKYQTILDPRITDITVRMLLQHSGGWDRNKTLDPMFNAYYIATTMGVSSPPSADVVIQYVLKYVKLNFTPGTQSQYSNFGYNVLGRVIEKITGQTYEDYVRNTILIPLGITDMQLGYNMLNNKLPNEVNYYDYPRAQLAPSIYDNSTRVPWPYGGFNVEFMDSHGGWVSTSEDLVKLVCAFDRFNTRPDILTTATIDTLTKPSVRDPNYAMGILVNQYNNWWHNGSLPGTTSIFIRYGDSQINWAILLNSRDINLSINTAVNNLLWNDLPTITSWPTFDLFTSTGIDENSDLTGIKSYPNPAHEKLTISFPSTLNKEISLKLYNSIGQQVFSQKVSDFINSTTIDVSGFAEGIYFIRVLADKNTIYNEKVIITK